MGIKNHVGEFDVYFVSNAFRHKSYHGMTVAQIIHPSADKTPCPESIPSLARCWRNDVLPKLGTIPAQQSVITSSRPVRIRKLASVDVFSLTQVIISREA